MIDEDSWHIIVYEEWTEEITGRMLVKAHINNQRLAVTATF